MQDARKPMPEAAGRRSRSLPRNSSPIGNRRLPCLGLLLMLAASPAVAADFKHGLDAYNRKDYPTAVAEWAPLADAGNAAAQNNLGWLYENGWGVPRDYSRAYWLYQQSAAAGNAQANSNLGDLYFYGNGVVLDYKAAGSYYEKAAAAGDTNAEFKLGVLYHDGKGRPRDYAQARTWFQKAEKGGEIVAAVNLGVMNEFGQGMPVDLSAAAEWYRKAAQAGNAAAQSQMGYLYLEGKGVPKDRATALDWYRKAAAQGDADAISALRILTGPQSGTPATGSGSSRSDQLRLGLDLMRIIVALSVLMGYFRHKKKGASASDSERPVPAPAMQPSSSPASVMSIPEFAVWNWANRVKAALLVGTMAAVSALILFLDMLMFTVGSHGGSSANSLRLFPGFISLFVLFFIWLSTRVILQVRRNRSSPALRVNKKGIFARDAGLLVPWPEIHRITLEPRTTQTKSGQQVKVPGGFQLLIGCSPTGTGAPPFKVDLQFPSIEAWSLLGILTTQLRDFQAAARSGTDFHLQVPSGMALGITHDPRSSSSALHWWGLDMIVLAWLVVAMTLGQLGLMWWNLSGIGWMDFKPAPLVSRMAGGIGLASGILLFLAVLPLWSSDAIDKDDYTAPGTFSAWNLLWLPVFAVALGYLPVAVAMPRIGNYLEGMPFQTTLEVIGKHYEPRHGKSGDCHALDVRESDNGVTGHFCVSASRYDDTRVGSLFNATGRRSVFGQALYDHDDTPQPPTTASVPGSSPDPSQRQGAGQAVAAVKPIEPPAPASASPDAPSATADAENAARQHCLDLSADYRHEPNLRSHALMAQACSRVGMPFE